MRFPLIGAALAIALAPLGALADPPGGCPPGLAKKDPRCAPPGHARNYRDRDRQKDWDDRRDRDAGPYPYRNRDSYRDRERNARDYYYRREAPRDYGRYYGRDLGNGYYVLREPRRFELDPRYDYYIRDGRIYRVDPDSRAIMDIVGMLQNLLN